MSEQKQIVYPYMPNSAPQVRAEMLKEIGIEDVSTIYQEIPKELRLNRRMNLPEPLLSEYDLKKYFTDLLGKNKTCEDYVSFLGSGCWQHYVPVVCDEINQRGEFLTTFLGAGYSDHGKYQAWWEYQSMLAELVDMDVVGMSDYDGTCAGTSAALIAARVTERSEILIPKNLNPEKTQHMTSFCRGAADIKMVNYDARTGRLDLADLQCKISSKTAAVYFENPTYMGVIESQGEQISKIAHDNGAFSVVWVDPISLGLLEPPSHYGADITCGELQPLGMHMFYGGGLAGFIAVKNDPKVLAEYPLLLITIAPGKREGEYGYGFANWDLTSWVKRERSKDYTGTTTGLWAITAGVYLALMGPQGMREIGEAIMSKAAYAAERLAKVKGVTVPFVKTPAFKEFVANFDGTGKTVKEINRALLDKGIFGGRDLSKDFPELGQSALYCVTEVISKESIDRLVDALGEVAR